MVASQPQRNFVLTGSLVLPTMLTDTIQRYFLLERIGRSVVCVLLCVLVCMCVCACVGVCVCVCVQAHACIKRGGAFECVLLLVRG